jgi:hypothetical protein
MGPNILLAPFNLSDPIYYRITNPSQPHTVHHNLQNPLRAKNATPWKILRVDGWHSGPLPLRLDRWILDNENLNLKRMRNEPERQPASFKPRSTSQICILKVHRLDHRSISGVSSGCISRLVCIRGPEREVDSLACAAFTQRGGWRTPPHQLPH